MIDSIVVVIVVIIIAVSMIGGMLNTDKKTLKMNSEQYIYRKPTCCEEQKFWEK